MTCAEFEELLSDYLEETLGKAEHVACATHVIGCTACHQLLNEVRSTIEACHSMAAPTDGMSPLEVRILARTAPGALLDCGRFEEHLTDYLDGFLEATVYHRWERHASVCSDCGDLPGTVIRSLAACASVRWDQVSVPDGLERRILDATVGETRIRAAKPRVGDAALEWLKSLGSGLPLPQMASFAAIMLFAAVFLVDGVSADGSVSGVYTRGFELASQTYRQGAEVVLGAGPTADGPREAQENNR